MGERAFVNCRITFEGQYASCIRILQSVTFEVTVEDLDTCIGHRDDARHFLMGLPCTAIKRKNAVIHFEDAALDHNDAVHGVLDIELPNTVFTSIVIKFNVFLVSFHVELLVGTCQKKLEVVYSANIFGPYINDEARFTFLSDCNIQRLLDWLKNQAGFPVTNTIPIKRHSKTQLT